MFYVKNVPGAERILRVVLGIGLVVGALVVLFQPTPGGFSMLLVVVLIGSALFPVATGFVGWCPACALVGRKLKTRQRAQ